MGGDLTPAERLVVEAAALGLSARTTADRLGKSLETVKTQRRMAMARLGAISMANAVWLLALGDRSPWSCSQCGGEHDPDRWPGPCGERGSSLMGDGRQGCDHGRTSTGGVR